MRGLASTQAKYIHRKILNEASTIVVSSQPGV